MTKYKSVYINKDKIGSYLEITLYTNIQNRIILKCNNNKPLKTLTFSDTKMPPTHNTKTFVRPCERPCLDSVKKLDLLVSVLI